MIVKDGQRYIEQCIESVLPAVTEIIIVDTGSTDSTLEKIKRFNPSVYHMQWNNNFSDARNFSIKYATGDYVIVLDADEVVYSEDLPKLVEVMKNTRSDCLTVRFHNLTDENDDNVFNMHEGLRIFKNGLYRFEGAIHEQPVFNLTDRIPITEQSGIRIKHYGYLKSNSGEKKFNRNMTILNEVLEKTPNEPFHLFNMGNQYMSTGDYNAALKYYDKAHELKDIKLAYSPHLIFRRVSCLKNLCREEDALIAATQGLKLYPACTDLEFLRGLLLAGMKRYTLAIDSFTRCVEMGQAPPNLCFFPNTENIRPMIELAEIYNIMDDHHRALEYYLRAIKVDGKAYYLIYKIAASLNKLFADKSMVYKNLCNLFADSSYRPNAIVMTDALLNEKLFEQAEITLDTCMNSINDDDPEENADIIFLRGRMLFYAKEYNSAFQSFRDYICTDKTKGILPNMESRARKYMLACGLLCNDCRDFSITLKEVMDDSIEKSVYHAFLEAASSPLDDKALCIISQVLSNLLAVSEYDVFEKALNILNIVESNNILLRLSKIYFNNGFHDMAVKTILRSVKELGTLDSEAIMILSKKFAT